MKEVRSRLAEKFSGEVPDGRVIKLWEEKLFATGSLLDQSRSGRPLAHGDALPDVRASLAEAPQTSVRQRASEFQIPSTSMYRLIRSDGYKAFKPTLTQFLSEEDEDIRLTACGELMDKYPSTFSRRNFFFSDECAIYADGKMENVVWWSKQNPHFEQQVKHYPPMIMVWAAMSCKDLIGPFFISGRVTSDSYITMLEAQFIPALVQRGLGNKAVFQQDGAPAHTSFATREVLQKHFPNRWVGKFGPTPWPPRSPDLTSCDNALWGIVKKLVKADKVTTKENLKASISHAFTQISIPMLSDIHERTWRRIALCIALEGKQVDPYDK